MKRWMDQGVMNRREALRLARYWIALGPRYSFRSEPLYHKDLVRAFLAVDYRYPEKKVHKLLKTKRKKGIDRVFDPR